MQTARQRVGFRGEDRAAHHVESLGWRILERNWRCGEGEADLVCHDPEADALVIVEVKTRRGLGYGSPLEVITYEKVRRLRRLAAIYAREHRVRCRRLRVDAIGVLWPPGQEAHLIHARGIEER